VANHFPSPGSLHIYVGTTRRQKFDKLMVWLVVAGLVAGLGWGAVGCLNNLPAEEARPVSAEEAGRLARVKTTAAEAGTVAMRLDLPESLGDAGLEGYVDLSTPIVHAATRDGSETTGLVQAIPGLIASHAKATEADPSQSPDNGWTVRRMQASEDPDVDPGQAVTDILLSAVLALGTTSPVDANFLEDQGVWLREAIVDGATVDVIRAPLLLQANTGEGDQAVASPDAMFWVDHDSRLRRLQVDPAGSGLATVDLLLDQPEAPSIEPVDVLGGSLVEPRDLTDEEATRLAGLRHSNSQRAAEVDLALPVGDDALITAKGWVDWRSAVVYLAVDAPGEDNDGLLFVLPSGAATLSTEVDGLPPQTPPQEGWTAQRWDDRVDSGEAGDIDTLLYKLLSMAALEPDAVDQIAETSAWLREDTIADTTVDVVEFGAAGEAETEPGTAAFRYWLDQDEPLLHRIQLLTNGFGYGRLDLAAAEPPIINIPYGIVTALAG